MQRGSLTSLGAAILLAVTVVSGCGGDVGPPESIVHRRPNLVYVVIGGLDQTSTPPWEALPRTKELIADRGMTFENSFATDPVCCAAQATLLTGMYPHNTNVFQSGAGLEAFGKAASKRSIGVRLKAAGYTTAFVGNYLDSYELDPSYVPPGWDDWFGLAGESHRDVDHQTDVIARKARDFVAEATQEKDHAPFLLSLFPTAPDAARGPAARDKDNRYDDEPLPSRRNVDEKDVSDKPSWLRAGFPPLSTTDKRHLLAGYRARLGSLLAVDDMVASLEAQLRASGDLDNTVFVFVSDSGYSFGSHRIAGTAAPYDEPSRVPLAIAGPGIEHGTSAALTAHIDLPATLYDLAGVPVPSDVDGRSLLPLLEGHHPAWRKSFMIEYRASPKVALHTYADVQRFVALPGKKRGLVPDYRALRSGEWLYVEWYQGTQHEYELYDERRDPYQLNNLMADPTYAFTHAKTISALHDRLASLAACKGASCR
jgi:arylsulfatase A-like enzyme